MRLEAFLFLGLLLLLTGFMALIAKFYRSKSGKGIRYQLFVSGTVALLAGQLLILLSSGPALKITGSLVTLCSSLGLALLSILLYINMMSVKE